MVHDLFGLGMGIVFAGFLQDGFQYPDPGKRSESFRAGVVLAALCLGALLLALDLPLLQIAAGVLLALLWTLLVVGLGTLFGCGNLRWSTVKWALKQ
jgi:hypothetical protein